MTDDIFEPHDQEAGHDGGAESEHAEVHEAPSDYEFADHDSATSDPSVSEVKVKGRSALPAILAAVGGVVLLGGVAWWQFSGSSAPEPLTTLASTPPVSVTPLNSPQNTTPSAPISTQPVTPKVASAASQDIAAAAPIISPPVPPAVPVVPVMGGQQDGMAANAPVIPSAVPPMQPVVSPIPTPTANGMPPVLVSASNPNYQRIDALNSRIEDLQKSLNQVTQQLSQVSNMVAASTPAAPSKDMQDRLDKLEQKVAQVHAAPVLSTPDAAPVDYGAPMVIGKPAKVTHHKEVVHVMHHKAMAQKATKPHHTAAAAPEESSPHWVLRAAVPGQAWIAESATAKDLKPLHVGDIIAGIGQITSIESKNGSWVVEGTRGAIR